MRLFSAALRSGLVAAVMGLAALPLLTAPPAAAAETGSDSRPREATITVSGEGEATLQPDMAILTFSVVRQARTAGEALADNNAAMTAVLKDLKEAGIAERDLRTSGFQIAPQYRQRPAAPGGFEPAEIAGYSVSNELTVTLRQLSRLGEVLDRAVRLGVNDGGGIRFTNDKPEAAITAARKAAVAEAITKARTLTEAAGVRLGRVIEIGEDQARPMPVGAEMYRAAPMAKRADAVPVASGENIYRVTVSVTYAIEQ